MGKKHLSPEQRQEIIALYCSGVTIEALAAQFDRDRTNVNKVIPADVRRGHAFRPRGAPRIFAYYRHDEDKIQRREKSYTGRPGRPQQTHCKRGHLYTEQNTRWHKNGRECRRCANDNAKIRYNANPQLRAKIMAANRRWKEQRILNMTLIRNDKTLTKQW